MKPEGKRKIRNFTEKNEYLEGVQYIPVWGVLVTFGVYKLPIMLENHYKTTDII